LKCIQADILVMASVDIYAIVSTIENYENRTVTPSADMGVSG